MPVKQEESASSHARTPRTPRTPLFYGACWAPWLLIPFLGAGAALAWQEGMDLLAATPVTLSLIACCWEAQINRTHGEYLVFRGLRSMLLLACAALPLALGGGLLLQRAGPLSMGGAAMQDMIEVALPLMRQMEAQTETGVATASWTRSLVLPKDNAIEALISSSGEITLIRHRPHAILILSPVIQQRFGANRVRWKCSGGPSKELPYLCQR